MKEKESEEEIIQEIDASGDIVSNEERSQQQDVQESSYDLVPHMEEGDKVQACEEVQESITPLVTSIPSREDSPSSSLDERSAPNLESLQEENEVINNQNNLTIFCLFADCEPIGFEEATQNKKWRDTMD